MRVAVWVGRVLALMLLARVVMMLLRVHLRVLVLLLVVLLLWLDVRPLLVLLVLRVHLRVLVVGMMTSVGDVSSIGGMHRVVDGPVGMMQHIIRSLRPALPAHHAGCKLVIGAIRTSPIARPFFFYQKKCIISNCNITNTEKEEGLPYLFFHRGYNLPLPLQYRLHFTILAEIHFNITLSYLEKR